MSNSIYLSRDGQEFAQRWLEKRQEYTSDTLADSFDAFFTCYVIYNFLYAHINRFGPRRSENLSERCQATELVPEFLTSQVISADPRIQHYAIEICKFMDHVNNDWSTRKSIEACGRLTRLQSGRDTTEWSESLFEVLYEIRCNIFHGRKPFKDPQRLLLIQCIGVLDCVNNMTINKMSPAKRGPGNK